MKITLSVGSLLSWRWRNRPLMWVKRNSLSHTFTTSNNCSMNYYFRAELFLWIGYPLIGCNRLSAFSPNLSWQRKAEQHLFYNNDNAQRDRLLFQATAGTISPFVSNIKRGLAGWDMPEIATDLFFRRGNDPWTILGRPVWWRQRRAQRKETIFRWHGKIPKRKICRFSNGFQSTWSNFENMTTQFC